MNFIKKTIVTIEFQEIKMNICDGELLYLQPTFDLKSKQLQGLFGKTKTE